MVDATKLSVETGIGADKMAEAMFGPSIKIVSASYQGDAASAGLWSGGDKVAGELTPSDQGVILSTGRASDITNAKGQANQSDSWTSDTKGVDNDADMNGVAGTKTFDGAIFKADFVPQGSTLTMQVTFSSEEYQNMSVTGWNDAVGVWVNGTKMQMTVGKGDITVNNINGASNKDLYVNNGADQFNTEMNGFTVTLTLRAPVKAGEINSIKIGIADGGDAAFDSNLLIAGHSIDTPVIAHDDQFEMQLGDKAVVDLVGNDDANGKGSLTITQINGQPVKAGDVVTLANGVEVVVNADGTVTLVADTDDKPGETSFSYQVSDDAGNTDTGLVQGSVVPCFVAGTCIATPTGLRPVEALRPGDMVLTLDRGPQTVRWAGSVVVQGMGETAPVVIPAGAFGPHDAVWLSPQHRVCLGGWAAEMVTGATQVLARARHLVAAGIADCRQIGAVSYVHVMFDRHEIIAANGLWCESYRPGPASLAAHSEAVRAELFALFPALARDPAGGHAPLARPEARADELIVAASMAGLITPDDPVEQTFCAEATPGLLAA
jgi:Hint domain/Bacterial Ig domain